MDPYMIMESVDFVIRQSLRIFSLTDLYGPSGVALYAFGARTTWLVQAQVLGKLVDNDALDFKKAIQDECTMISVAVRSYAFLSKYGLLIVQGCHRRSDYNHRLMLPEDFSSLV